jgi:hypothetical protein
MLTQHVRGVERGQGPISAGLLFAPEFTAQIAGKNRVLRRDGDIAWTNDGFSVRTTIDAKSDEFAVMTVVGQQVGGLLVTDEGMFELFPEKSGYLLLQVHPNLDCLTLSNAPHDKAGIASLMAEALAVASGRRRAVAPPASPAPRQYLFLIDQWYTGDMLTKLGTLDAVKLKIQMKVDLTNTIFTRSGLANIQFRTQNVYLYGGEAESGVFEQQPKELVAFSVDPDVNRKRDEDHAHFATLWHEKGNGMTWRPFGAFDRKLGFQLLVEGGVFDLPHELLHNFDADHDAAHSMTGDSCSVGGGCTSLPDPVPYGRGHIDKVAQFGCLMSYFTEDNCPGFCERAPFISSSDPSLTYKGYPTGSPMEDNARVVRENVDKAFRYAL